MGWIFVIVRCLVGLLIIFFIWGKCSVDGNNNVGLLKNYEEIFVVLDRLYMNIFVIDGYFVFENWVYLNVCVIYECLKGDVFNLIGLVDGYDMYDLLSFFDGGKEIGVENCVFYK